MDDPMTKDEARDRIHAILRALENAEGVAVLDLGIITQEYISGEQKRSVTITLAPRPGGPWGYK